jgi:RHS repeat-associated protein
MKANSWIRLSLVSGVWLLAAVSGHCFWNSGGRHTVTAAAKALSPCDYGPSGIPATGSLGNASRVSNEDQADETGFHYYGFRYYNASTGKWLSRDPLEEEAGFNLYTFVSNDATIHWDALGEKCCLLTWYPTRSISGTKTAWGHSALQCDNNTYVSAWPKGGNERKTDDAKPVVWRDFDTDKTLEARSPDSALCTDCLDEGAVTKWLESMKAGNPMWQATAHNCADYTREAILAGLHHQRESCCGIGLMPKDYLAKRLIQSPSDVKLQLGDLIANRCQRWGCVAMPNEW